MLKRFRSSDGLSLAYRDSGSGRPLLCLAGLTRNSTDFDYMSARLSNVRLLRPDYRGRGESSWDRDWRNYTAVVEARDAVELLDHLGIDRIPVLGTSRGGLIAMILAVSHKDRIAGAMLNDIGPEIKVEGLDRIRDHIGINPDYASYDEAARQMQATAPGFENVSVERWRGEAERRYVSNPDGGLRINYDPKLREAFNSQLDTEIPDLWPFFRALEGRPTGLIRGANSDLLSRETAAKMRDALPDLIFAEVPERGHCPFLDEPESLEAIERMLAKVYGQRA